MELEEQDAKIVSAEDFDLRQGSEVPEGEKNLASYFMLEIEQSDRASDNIGIKFIFEPNPVEIEGPMTDVMLMGVAVMNTVNGLKKEIEELALKEFEEQKRAREQTVQEQID